jgi:hypothetical protein
MTNAPVSASSDVTFKYSLPQPAGKAVMSRTPEQLLPASEQMVNKPRSTASLPKPWITILAMFMNIPWAVYTLGGFPYT